MTRTVDVVIVGEDAAAVAAASDAVGCGLRVLMVVRRARSRVARRVRDAVATDALRSPLQLTVLTGSEVACVDGVKSIEAVVVRQLRTGRLIAFNASAMI